ncbi:MAG TPA: hypothetical protein VMC86_11125 [Gemmatimonadales bacterium]|nr:hypothetical protein [Gemmatimonadales bacterium]
MIQITLRPTLVAAAILVACPLTAQTPPHAIPHPDLSGRWKLNLAKSDDPETMLTFDTTGAVTRPQGGGGTGGGGSGSGGYGGRSGGSGGFGGRGMGGGRRGGSGGPPRGDAPPPLSESQRQGFRQALRLALNPPSRLAVAQTDSTVTFGGDTATVPLHGDGRTVVIPPNDSASEVRITARWLGNAFLVSRQVVGGGRVTEDYLRSADGSQITVIVHFDGGVGRSLDFRLVYDLIAS